MKPISFLAPAALVCCIAAAQHDAASPNPLTAVATAGQWPGERIVTDAPGDGSIQAVAARWKAAFAPDGVRFVPSLGSSVPSHDAMFRLSGITAGERVVPVVDAAPELRGDSVIFPRGSVQEIYRLRQDGIEQQFLLSELPCRGELRVAIAVSTALRAEARADGHAFLGAAGGIHYGTATAFDAVGRSIALPTRWHADALEITVPESFVATAVMPLLIDPLIGPLATFAAITTEQLVTDVAYDPLLGQHYVTIERFYSANDHDVYVTCLDAALQVQWQLVIDITTEYWSKPSVAALAAHGVGCVVAETSAANQSPFAIRARRFLGGSSPVLHPVQQVAVSAQYDRCDPDIGGDSALVGPSRFLLVWESKTQTINSSDLRFVQLDADGNFLNPTIVPTGIGFHRRPRVSKTCGRPGGGTEQWVIVSRQEYYNQTDGRLVASFVTRNGQFRWVVGGSASAALTALLPNFSSDWDVSSPTDDGFGRHALCVESRFNLVTGRASLVGIVIDRNGNTPLGISPIAAGNLDHRRPRVDSDGVRFAVAHEAVYSATDSDVHVRTMRLDNGFLHQDDLALATTSLDRESRPAICADALNQYLVAWTHRSGNQYPIECRAYRGVASGFVTRRPIACGGLGIQSSGNSELGGTVTFTLGGAAGLAGFMVGAPTNMPIAPCPGCLQGANGQALLGTSFSITIPLQPALVGFPVAIQGFHFVPAGNAPCLGQIELSDAMDFRVR